MRDPFHTIHFEAAEGGEPPAAPPPPTPAPAPEWGGPSQEEWQQLQNFQRDALPVLQQLDRAMREAQAAPQNAPAPPPVQQPELDPFNPESIQNYIREESRRQAQDIIGQYDDLLGATAASYGEQMARRELENVKALPDAKPFDEDAALIMAAGLIDAESNMDPAVAVRQAAAYAQEYESRIRADERQKVTNELQGLSTAPQPPTPAPGAPVLQGKGEPLGHGDRGISKYESVVADWLANEHPTMPVG